MSAAAGDLDPGACQHTAEGRAGNCGDKPGFRRRAPRRSTNRDCGFSIWDLRILFHYTRRPCSTRETRTATSPEAQMGVDASTIPARLRLSAAVDCGASSGSVGNSALSCRQYNPPTLRLCL